MKNDGNVSGAHRVPLQRAHSGDRATSKENPGIVYERQARSLLVGDALGVPYEFHTPEAIPPLEQIKFSPPNGFSRAHSSVPPGTWSEDGPQALALLHSLIADQRDV
ncbi:ADP-ribosylglycohydrolase family protein [Thermomonas aquatica]|uniref:ADP-ribosylglycohydrolase family protein n=1 Tax=Thermomonas aquatica TaxID=2202149 RepID=A0A5B7ZQ17_9GAMM|nr:ADP-ribosylglycohydrolase family protein [Thermomonas aquatica]QDA56977.1 ADP-ribosylglycohydrolase family protein [Thermomonas aquatica]